MQFAPTPGEYNAAVMVVLSCETAQADIYYTIDGAVPTKNSRKYSLRGPFLVQKTTTVRARYASGLPSSRPGVAKLNNSLWHAGGVVRTQGHLPAQRDGPDRGGDVHHQRALNGSFVRFRSPHGVSVGKSTASVQAMLHLRQRPARSRGRRGTAERCLCRAVVANCASCAGPPQTQTLGRPGYCPAKANRLTSGRAS